MASDRSQFNNALRKWDGLRMSGEYSVPMHQGDTAILVSGCSTGETRREQRKERNDFEQEAYTIARAAQFRGFGAFVVSRFTFDDAAEILRDRSVSSIVTIGHGDLSSIYIDDDDKLDWLDIARMSDHLKTGTFTQRHCGSFLRDLSVPMGTFAMKQHSQVQAAKNDFLPTHMDESDEAKIRTVHGFERLQYRLVKTLYPTTKEEKENEE